MTRRTNLLPDEDTRENTVDQLIDDGSAIRDVVTVMAGLRNSAATVTAWTSNTNPVVTALDNAHELIERLTDELIARHQKAGSVVDAVSVLQGSCPDCGGHGHVLGMSGGEDCPSVDLHVLLARVAGGWEQARAGK